MEKKYYTDERNVQIVIALLKAHGIKKIIASPGATNITFVASVQQDPWFEIYSCVDERSAAYMACGMAEESKEPVVLSCTGATASRNYMPGLTEAFYRKLPIIAITSHKGNHLIGHLEAQQIDRRNPPADVVRTSVTIPTIKDKVDERFCEIETNKAILAAKQDDGGPVHINLFTTFCRKYETKELPQVSKINRYTLKDKLPELNCDETVAVFIGSHKQLELQYVEAIDKFCFSNNAFVIYDHTSGYNGHFGIHLGIISSQKNLQKKVKIDTLVHIGEISGDYYSMMIHPKRVWRVNEDGALRDTFGKLTDVFQMDELDFFKHYSNNTNNDSLFKSYKQEYDNIMSKIPELPFSNIWIAQQMAPQMPKGCNLHLGILNTLRSWDFFDVPINITTNCNVGGFGIDGNMSSLIGASLVHPQKLYFGIFGDLSFFYDMNSAGNRHVGNNVRILLINNGRGTEFRNYGNPGSIFGNATDEYISAARHFGNKSQLLVKHYAEDLGFKYLTASDKESFLKMVPEFISPTIGEKPYIFEVFTDSKDESQALRVMLNLIETDSNPKSLKQSIASTVKNIVGEKAFNMTKSIIKK